MGLPRCTQNSILLREIKVLTVKSRTETHFRQTLRLEANSSAKCDALANVHFNSIFALMLKVLVHFASKIDVEIYREKHLLITKTAS